MAFSPLVPGMQPIPIPAMKPNAMMQQGMQAMNMARGMQQPQQPGGQPPMGLLQRLLNPPGPAAGGPTNLAAPGMPPNGGGAPVPMQMGLLAKLFPALGGGQPQAPAMPQGDPTGGMGPLY